MAATWASRSRGYELEAIASLPMVRVSDHPLLKKAPPVATKKENAAPRCLDITLTSLLQVVKGVKLMSVSMDDGATLRSCQESTTLPHPVFPGRCR